MNRFKNILYVVEPLAQNTSSLERAIELTESNRANLTVVDIVPEISADVGLPPGGPISNELQATLQKEHQARLETMITPYASKSSISTKVLTGTVFLEVIRAVLRDEYDLVMKTAENPGWLDRLFGSNDMHLLRKCPCPVLLQKSGESVRYKSVVASVELPATEFGSDGLCQQILKLASSLTTPDFSELHVVHAWQTVESKLLGSWADNPSPAEQAYIKSINNWRESAFLKLREDMKELLGEKAFDHLSPKFHLLMGAPEEIIPAQAEQLHADIVVMGTLSRAGIAGLFIGNEAEAILEQLRCSVLAIKPAGFETPVKLS